MKDAAGILEDLPALRKNEPGEPREDYGQARELINHVFATFERTWPGHFQKLYPTREKRLATKSLWRQSREFRALRPEQVESGVMSAMEKFEYVPSLATFLKLCREDRESVAEKAWYEAVRHCHEVATYSWSSPRVRQAGNLTGWFEIRGATGKMREELKKRFVSHYLALSLECSAKDIPAIEDQVSGKTAVEQFQRHSEIEIKNRVMTDGCRDVKGMAGVMAMMGE